MSNWLDLFFTFISWNYYWFLWMLTWMGVAVYVIWKS